MEQVVQKKNWSIIALVLIRTSGNCITGVVKLFNAHIENIALLMQLWCDYIICALKSLIHHSLLDPYDCPTENWTKSPIPTDKTVTVAIWLWVNQ